mmetsp:Transcript_44998/g.54526  ORF Transcript_44998/g.54526 Transcript_44998/m.54526 type:complete len:226 (-) Transcript_44998:98-775(-)
MGEVHCRNTCSICIGHDEVTNFRWWWCSDGGIILVVGISTLYKLLQVLQTTSCNDTCLASSPIAHILLHQACHYQPPLSTIQAIASIVPESMYNLDEQHRYPLHIAIENGAPFAVIKYLLTQFPGAVTSRDRDGKTPLHLLFHYVYCNETSRLLKIIRLLYRSEPSVVTIEDVLEYAIMLEMDMKVVKYLQALTVKERMRNDQIGENVVMVGEDRLSHSPLEVKS